MPAARITCPRCNLSLTVTERAPTHLSCPRCLAPLVNPSALASEAPEVLRAPVPVIPLDRQVERDTRIGTWLLISLMGLLALAAFVAFAARDARGGLFVLLIMAALGAFVIFTGVRTSARTAVPDEAGSLPPPMPSADGTTVLEYGVPRRSTGPATAGAVAAGFFSAIGVCGVGIAMLAGTASSLGGASSGHGLNALVLGAVVAMVVAYIVLTVRNAGRWRGFGPGATAGLVLGLLALGPCAACYLLAMGH